MNTVEAFFGNGDEMLPNKLIKYGQGRVVKGSFNGAATQTDVQEA